jgi:glycosyltransferase involved in cell wall biosynthesis
MATGQYLSEVARDLASRGHEVMVVTSRRAYDQPEKRFAIHETWNGVKIFRVASIGLGKQAKWRRALDFASFITTCCWQLLFLPRPDVVVALTSPPLISFIGAAYARLRGARFVYWVMDLNPDEAIAAGWLSADSWMGQILAQMSRYSFRHAGRIIALDRFMQARIVGHGTVPEKIVVVPPWSHDEDVRYDPVGRATFRAARGLNDKFVIMYSGNHSPCHPLATLLAAARELAREPRYAFVFIGGGSEFERVKQFAAAHKLTNVRCEPYLPLKELAASLSAADLQVVVMGDAFVGIVHPCKIYNLIRVQAPILYIGPESSHVGDVTSAFGEGRFFARCAHGDTAGVVHAIHSAAAAAEPNTQPAVERITPYSRATLLPQLVKLIEDSVT